MILSPSGSALLSQALSRWPPGSSSPHSVCPLEGPPGTLCNPEDHVADFLTSFKSVSDSTVTSQTTHYICSPLRRLAGCTVSSRVGFLTSCLVAPWPVVISWLQPELASVTGWVVGRLSAGPRGFSSRTAHALSVVSRLQPQDKEQGVMHSCQAFFRIIFANVPKANVSHMAKSVMPRTWH